MGGMTNAPYVYAKLGDTVAANRVVRAMEANSPPPWYAEMERASVSLAVGDTAGTLAALERLAQTAGPAMISQLFSVIDPVYDPLRQSPRFAALLRQATLDVRSLTAPRAGRPR